MKKLWQIATAFGRSLINLKKMAASPEQEMQIKQLEADLKNAQNRVSQLARMLENNKIKAPFDGGRHPVKRPTHTGGRCGKRSLRQAVRPP